MENKELVVQKYGGSSVATPEKIGKVAEYICETAKEKKVVVVVSAMGDETDRLIKLANEVYGGPPPIDELYNKLLATGEEQSAPLLAMAIRRLGTTATSLTGWQIQLEADSKGRVKRVRKINTVNELLDQNDVVVVAGFQGIIEGTDKIATLGRGGSDLTAVVLAAALRLYYCEIFTDVDGVYTVDPQLVPEAKRFSRIAYDQMIQLSEAGVGKPQGRSVALAHNLGVKIKVLLSPSFGRTTSGTLICSDSNLEEMENSWYQPGIAIKKKVKEITIVDVPNKSGVAVKVIEAIAGINIEDGLQPPGGEKTDMFFFYKTEDVPRVLSRLRGIKEPELVGKIKIPDPRNVVELTLIYPLMGDEPDYLYRVFKAMARVGVNIETFSTSGTTIMVTVKEENLEKAARALAEEFELLL
ncbi:MAG: aspartate kinase [Candidatus Magasanikbacteria bacterium]|nr:aspartate kinase [Candidatus Magasanikbacteria bacterium]